MEHTLTIPQRLDRRLVQAVYAVQMALTDAERDELSEYVLERSCTEFRRDEPCIQRKESAVMIGEQHAGCDQIARMLALIAKA